MKNPRIEHVDKPDLEKGHFNRGAHLFVEIEPGQWQTISARLPNGKFVTFAFIPGGEDEPDEMECVDIQTTVGPDVPRRDGEKPEHLQHLLGFTVGTDTFSTRQCDKPTTLATLLLHRKHYATEFTRYQAGRLVAGKQGRR